MKTTIKKILILIFILLLALAFVFHFDHYLTIATFNANKLYLKNFVTAHYFYAALLYMGIYTLIVSCSLPTGGLVTLAGGFLFGVVPGTIYAVISATLGALVAFVMTRYFIGETIEQRYPKYVQRFNNEIKNYGYSYMLFLRLVTFVPFFLVNLVAGMTKLSAFTFAWTTLVGIIPATAVFAFAGQQLATVTSLHDIISYKVMLSFGLLAILALTPMLFGRFILTKIRRPK